MLKSGKKLTGANVNRQIAIVLDNYVYSAPNVQNEIPNGQSSITGNFTVEQTQDLANILKAGSLPAPTTIVENVVVGPTLGDVARKQGIISIVAGLGIVLIFMIAYYAKRWSNCECCSCIQRILYFRNSSSVWFFTDFTGYCWYCIDNW